MAEAAKKTAAKVPEKKVEKKVEKVEVAPSTPLQDVIASREVVDDSVKESFEYEPINTKHSEELPAYAPTPYVKGDFRAKGSTKSPDDETHAITLEEVRAAQWEQHQKVKAAQAKADAKK